MEINPIDTAAMIGEVSKDNPLNAFMMFVIIALIGAIAALYRRLIKLGDDQQSNLIASTVALNNNTAALEALQEQSKRTEAIMQKVFENLISGR